MADYLEEREGADITAEHMIIREEIPSDIQKFYENSVIFITGGSGFLGTLLVEKLLRSCSSLSKLYILIRPKKGKSPEQRFDDFFKDVVFDKMVIEQPTFHEKVFLIEGDCEQPNLNLSDEDTEKLLNEVNIVFHAAATVKFDEKLRKAVDINIRGTKDIVLLSHKIKNLKAFVHVSTAYSNCTLKQVDEVFYNVEMTGDKLIDICKLLSDKQLDVLTPTLIEPWPNTYTFTKAVAENLVRKYGKGLPISIVRPSIVISTYKEPVAGWINNFYGAVGVSIGAALGLLRTLHCDPENLADVVPADYSINSMIVSAWLIGHNYLEENKETINNELLNDIKMEDNMPIFNYVSSNQNPLTWLRYMALAELHGLKYPSPHCMWYYCFFLNPNKYIHNLFVLFLHYIPGFIIDTCLFVVGKKPILLKAYKKIHKFSNVLTYFTKKEWIFLNQNTQNMWKKLNKTDRRLFEFDINLVVWTEFFLYLCTWRTSVLVKRSIGYFTSW